MVSPEIAQALKIVDDFDPRPGYACNGDSLPTKLSDETLRTRLEQAQPGILMRFPKETSWVYHWAPGMHGTTLPQSTGIQLNPGSVLVMQYHFHAINHESGHRLHEESPEKGGTIALRLADRVEKPAFFQTLSNDEWYDARRNGSLVVPPQKRTSVQTLYPLKSLLPLIQDKTGLSSLTHIEIHSANLHMHSRGIQAETWLEQQSGERDTMLAIKSYSYNGQRDYFLKSPKVISKDAAEGLAMGIRCTYFNPGEEPVYGGLYSEDEMCINFFYVAAAGSR